MFQLLAINCYCEDENDSYWNYREMLERYEFLEHMPFSSISPELLEPLIKHYDFAFGASDYIKGLHKQDD